MTDRGLIKLKAEVKRLRGENVALRCEIHELKIHIENEKAPWKTLDIPAFLDRGAS
jgi:hypothetical protein